MEGTNIQQSEKERIAEPTEVDIQSQEFWKVLE